MESDRSSLTRRLIAIAVLVVVAVIAIRLVIGFVVGVVTAIFWIALIVALVVAFFWARSTLKSGKRGRKVKGSGAAEVAAPAEDPVAAEMRRITEQLRDRGRS